MREIKFRAFQDNIMYYQKNSGIYGSKRFLDSLYEDCALMQYIGLKDKNGVEIYEGDIIKDDEYEEPYVVEYSDKLVGFVGWGDDKISGCYILNSEDSEIIGNIYENPELLK